jgi:hypothetical protein
LGKQQWLRPDEDRLKTGCSHFCNCLTDFKWKGNNFTNLKVDDKTVTVSISATDDLKIT